MKLKTYMAENDLTQAEVAAVIKTTRQTVSNLIADKCIVIEGVIYSPRYNIEQLAEGKKK